MSYPEFAENRNIATSWHTPTLCVRFRVAEPPAGEPRFIYNTPHCGGLREILWHVNLAEGWKLEARTLENLITLAEGHLTLPELRDLTGHFVNAVIRLAKLATDRTGQFADAAKLVLRVAGDAP